LEAELQNCKTRVLAEGRKLSRIWRKPK